MLLGGGFEEVVGRYIVGAGSASTLIPTFLAYATMRFYNEWLMALDFTTLRHAGHFLFEFFFSF